MGHEAHCHARVRDAAGVERRGPVRALLESDAVILRPAGPEGVRARVPRAALTEVRATDGLLRFHWPDGTVELALGDAAEPWAERLRAVPKSAVDKLGMKPGMVVSVLAVDDAALLADLDARAARVLRGELDPASDVVLLGVACAADLDGIARVAATLAPRAALWVLHPRGVREVRDTAIFDAARAAGLTYTKVARVSETHTAERLCWPRAAVGGRAARD